ncbi:LysR family transcriptional regulator [Burkholderia pseudomallei MSHR338]|uniref:LysR family transcriptional regulator n=1 Tax=Burkholderia pseudomallei TaxID=28450 RepID=UPI0001A422C2|nr:LysR family transcriptional regulator [Burkholderia pseudomallei]AIP06073.1 bacterial regulatory helix-turn-helix, lysR family protein [Burkholderia pseudomallei]EEP51460.1 transcriptional regulator, LysR family [Burkholderia pseudomallei MSHR346]EQA86061.1 LysR family transcriptional regulator [Burkholderia pseudomallei MSHR338]OMW32944.1 LysR family transcriptional regulator [Burkholderia pseudomallei]ONA26541.1 LysR family transcriptional regulator [Burkholderia pseudomallei]
MADIRDVNLNRLAIFVAVVEAGSLTAAAERLGLAKTMVSAHVQRLEAEVGASLVVRTTRRLNVTEAGRAFYDACRDILRATETALAAVAGDAGPLRGTLRVSAPVDYGALVVAPALEIELQCDDRVVDLVRDNLDVAIRLGRLADSNHRAAKLGGFERWLVASPAFVARHGAPASPEALGALPYVMLSTVPRTTLELANAHGERASVRCRRAFASNTATACRAAVLAGGGFGVATSFSSADDIAAGRLVRLLPGWSFPPGDIHAVFPSASHPSAKVRALIDMLKTRLAAPC